MSSLREIRDRDRDLDRLPETMAEDDRRVLLGRVDGALALIHTGGSRFGSRECLEIYEALAGASYQEDHPNGPEDVQ